MPKSSANKALSTDMLEFYSKYNLRKFAIAIFGAVKFVYILLGSPMMEACFIARPEANYEMRATQTPGVLLP